MGENFMNCECPIETPVFSKALTVKVKRFSSIAFTIFTFSRYFAQKRVTLRARILLRLNCPQAIDLLPCFHMNHFNTKAFDFLF